jgi:hypothetical protein
MSTTMPEARPAADAVRATPCPLCRRRPGKPCTPKGDHLARWLAGYSGGQIGRADLVGIIAGLVVITARELVPQRAA